MSPSDHSASAPPASAAAITASSASAWACASANTATRRGVTPRSPELVLEPDRVIRPHPAGAPDPGQATRAARRHDREVLVRAVAAAGRRRVDEVEAAARAVERALEGLHGHVRPDSAGLVEGGGEDGR